LGLVWLAESGDRCRAADLKLLSNCREFSASSGFIARLDFGELARWGRVDRARNQKAKTFCSFSLALPLLVLGVLADDANDAAAMNHLALVADRLY
jgi:hypothetical protein